MRVAAGFACLAAVVLCGAPGRGDEPTQKDLLRAVEARVQAVIESAGPAAACVVVSRGDQYPKPAKPPEHPGQLGGFDPDAFRKTDPRPGKDALAARLDLSDPRNIPDHGSAGGVVIDPSGLVLTNYHVIDGATKVYVHLPGGKGSYADIHAADARSDLAVLRLLAPPAGLKTVKLGEVRPYDGPGGWRASQLQGKLVVLLAPPHVTGFTIDRPSAAVGGLTNTRRLKRPESKQPGNPRVVPERYRSIYTYGILLEHDVRLAAGVSGAPLLNLDGELIGLTTSLAAVTGGESGTGYALPVDPLLRQVVEVLRRGEEFEYGFLGIQPQDETGIVLQTIIPQSPAHAAGLRPFDKIERINDHPAATFDDLLLLLGSLPAGARVKLGLRDQGNVEVTLTKFRNEAPFIASNRPEPVFGLRVDYGSVLAQGLDRNPRIDQAGVPPGVTVRELVPDSPAAAKFKALGENRWLITYVNGTPVRTPAEFYKEARGRPSVKLTYLDPTDPNSRPRDLTLP